MEGLVLGIEAGTSFAAYMGTLALLVFVVAAVFLGYMADEEKAGRRLFWAEWPLPETEVTIPDNVVQLRRAA